MEPISLEQFHLGERATLARVYERYFVTVHRAVGRVVHGPERENACQDVFLNLLSQERVRRQFTGGSMEAWLRRMAYSMALDQARRRRTAASVHAAVDRVRATSEDLVERLEAAEWVARFRATLPLAWVAVFDDCFVEGLDQRTAAQRRGISRSTLAYQWTRVMLLLRQFARGAA